MMYNLIIKLEEKMRNFFVKFVIILLFIPFQIFGSILGFDEAIIDLTEDSLNNNIEWSSQYELTDKGLSVYADTEEVQHNLWIKSNVIPVGLAFRPIISVNINVTINGEIGDSFLQNVYFRFGCDRVHWSTWYQMTIENESNINSITYNYQLILPEPARVKYNELLNEWRETEPVWICDETAFCYWISENYPDFFSNEFPFIGYLQFYYDSWWLNHPVTINSINAQMRWGVGGVMANPNDGTEPDTESKWYFDLR